MKLLRVDRYDEVTKRTKSYMICQDGSDKIDFDLDSRQDVATLESVVKNAFELAINNPGYVVDSKTMKVEGLEEDDNIELY